MPPTRGGKANTENLVCKGAGPQCPSKPALAPSTLTDSQTASRGRCGMGGLGWRCCRPPAFHPRLVPWPLQQKPSPLSVTDPCPTEVTTATTTDDFQGLWRGQPGTDTSSGKIPRLARDDLARNPPGRGLAIGLMASAQFCNQVQLHCLLQKPGSLSKPGTNSLCPRSKPHPVFTIGQTVTWESLHLPAHGWTGCCQPQGQKAVHQRVMSPMDTRRLVTESPRQSRQPVPRAPGPSPP